LDEDEYEEIDETFSDSSRPYKFKVGSTHIYSATVLGQEANEILTNYLKLHNGQPQGKHMFLKRFLIVEDVTLVSQFFGLVSSLSIEFIFQP
jgi:hypothetical protein